jgi:hypothetical protein
VGCEHGCRHVLGVGGWESEAGFEHVLQDRDEEAVEEFLCWSASESSGNGTMFTSPVNKLNTATNITKFLDDLQRKPYERALPSSAPMSAMMGTGNRPVYSKWCSAIK